MSTSPTISQQKILAAARGNPDLLEVLKAISVGADQQQAVTGTTPTSAPVAGQPNPAAPVPAQAVGTVSLLAGSYIVQLVNPGASSAISQLQSQQQTGNATSLTPLQPVTPIFHQIRASTSPAFNVNSNTQSFGGNTGSTQTYWTITGLGSGTWFFQFRSSYDGINFNTWKNVNSGAGIGGLINQVTEENVGDSNWALFTLPGGLVAGVGIGYCVDGEIFELASELYSSGMAAITGPNGLGNQTNGIYGMALSDVDLQVPVPAVPVTGIADYPVVIRDSYAIYGGTTQFPGNASVFAIAVDPSNENVTILAEGGFTPTTDAVWIEVQLPGGARIAIGQGRAADGATIWTPTALTWLSGSRMMSICTLTGWNIASGNTIQGWNLNALSGLTMQASYLDAFNNVVATEANWLAIAWQLGTDVQTISGVPFLKINLQGGHAIYLAAGQINSGSPVTLPAGCTPQNMLAFCTPGGCAASGGSIFGVQICAMEGLTPYLQYSGGNGGTALVSFMLACWI